MFDQLFKSPRAINHHSTKPLLEERMCLAPVLRPERPRKLSPGFSLGFSFYRARP
jgi:hypothetical protein